MLRPQSQIAKELELRKKGNYYPALYRTRDQLRLTTSSRVFDELSSTKELLQQLEAQLQKTNDDHSSAVKSIQQKYSDAQAAQDKAVDSLRTELLQRAVCIIAPTRGDARTNTSRRMSCKLRAARPL